MSRRFENLLARRGFAAKYIYLKYFVHYGALVQRTFSVQGAQVGDAACSGAHGALNTFLL